MSHPARGAASPRRAREGSLGQAEILAELAQILATGYLRLCGDAARGAQSGARQQRSAAAEGQSCAPARAGEGP